MTLLQRFLRANTPILKTTTLSKDHVIGREQIPQKNTLYMLAEIGTLDAALAWDVFNAVLYELSVPGRYVLTICSIIILNPPYVPSDIRFYYSHS